MKVLLGVDGGNTKTIALVAREDGTIVGAGRAGNSDHYGAPTAEAAYSAVVDAVDAALASAGASVSDIAGAAFSLAGADWPEDFDDYHRELGERLSPDIPMTVVNDAIGALRGGTSDGVGVAIACGTGTAVGARAADGTIWNVSFWAAPSFRYSLARGAIEAAAEAELGIAGPTRLQQLVPAATGHASVEDLLRAMTMRGATRPALGLTSGALLDAAAEGDATALRVTAEVAAAMADMVRASAARCGLDPPSPVVLAGGLFRHPCDALERSIRENLPGCEIVKARFEPAAGALLLAFDAAGVVLDSDRLEASLPSAELFASASGGEPVIWI
jgi:N-acetylglucosamine kinase-like BadF-type ATPase